MACVSYRLSHSFTCHLHTNHTCLYSPAAEHHRPLAGTHTHCAYPRRDGQAELTEMFVSTRPEDCRSTTSKPTSAGSWVSALHQLTLHIFDLAHTPWPCRNHIGCLQKHSHQQRNSSGSVGSCCLWPELRIRPLQPGWTAVNASWQCWYNTVTLIKWWSVWSNTNPHQH